jgi:hypothetical protein
MMLRMPFEVLEELLVLQGSNTIWYGFNDIYEIKRLDLSEKEPMTFFLKEREREKLSHKSKKKIFDKVLENYRQVPKNVLNTMVDQIPDEMPFFHHLASDKNGLIYVLTATGQYPHRRKVDIFSPQGEYLYRGLINLESECTIVRLAMYNEDLVVFVEDSEGERKMVKYTINIPDPPQ